MYPEMEKVARIEDMVAIHADTTTLYLIATTWRDVL